MSAFVLLIFTEIMTAMIRCCQPFLDLVMSCICIQRRIVGNVFYLTFTNVFINAMFLTFLTFK